MLAFKSFNHFNQWTLKHSVLNNAQIYAISLSVV